MNSIAVEITSNGIRRTLNSRSLLGCISNCRKSYLSLLQVKKIDSYGQGRIFNNSRRVL